MDDCKKKDAAHISFVSACGQEPKTNKIETSMQVKVRAQVFVLRSASSPIPTGNVLVLLYLTASVAVDDFLSSFPFPISQLLFFLFLFRNTILNCNDNKYRQFGSKIIE